MDPNDAAIALLIAAIMMLLNLPAFAAVPVKFMEMFYTGKTPESAVNHTAWTWRFFAPFIILHGGLLATFYQYAATKGTSLFSLAPGGALSAQLWWGIGISEIVWGIWFLFVALASKGYNAANPSTFKRVMLGSWSAFLVFGLVSIIAAADAPDDDDMYEKLQDNPFLQALGDEPALKLSGFKIVLLIFGINFLLHAVVFIIKPSLLWETFYIGKFPEDSKVWLDGFVYKFWAPWTFQTGVIYICGFLSGGLPPNACIANGVGSFAAAVYIFLSVTGLEPNYKATNPNTIQKAMSASWVGMLALFGVLSFLAYDDRINDILDV